MPENYSAHLERDERFRADFIDHSARQILLNNLIHKDYGWFHSTFDQDSWHESKVFPVVCDRLDFTSNKMGVGRQHVQSGR